MPTVYIVQSTQTPAFGVPLLNGRDGYLRAFVVADRANTVTPQVRVTIYDSGGTVQTTYTIAAPGASVPLLPINESSLLYSWNHAIPGSLIQPGYKLKVEVDPAGQIPENNESNNVWPVSGSPQTLDVRDLPMLNMTLVPVSAPLGLGNVVPGNADAFMDYSRRMQPIAGSNNEVPAIMNSSITLHADGTGWEPMLYEVEARRTADHSTRHYIGVVKVNYSSGVAGVGFVGYPVAVCCDNLPSSSWSLAHEIGHNWGYNHTACTGEEDGPDSSYPYAGGAIGVYGYDVVASSLKDKTTNKDVMSYCTPKWISEYTFRKILTYRESHPLAAPDESAPDLPEESCLLVWGHRSHGEMTLEPSFLIDTRPSLPTPGPYRIEGLDLDGRVLWSQEFDLRRTTIPDDPTSAGFCFAVPMSVGSLEKISVLRVEQSGAELARRTSTPSAVDAVPGRLPAAASLARSGVGTVDLAWDASRAPVVMIRDPDEDRCIGFARNGSMRLSSRAQRLELLFSDGVHTRAVRWPQE